ncbi:hypothetical protein KKF61_01250 [Patescibacteria group bacterium]|nr:hypothetical protein [Patescibacteria group bacterium]MBU0964075.1 hypothetical protein [Patescibacteria group bacterium]
MSLKQYLIIVSSATIICWLAWLVVLFYINPNEAGFVGFFLFYCSLIFALVGSFSLIGFFGRVWFAKEKVIFRHLGISTRQALWFSVLLTGVLMLKGANFLRWWTVLLIIILLVLLEFFFLSRRVVRH